jgi:ribonuclease HI
MHYIIFTDGACKGNPGPGGWGALVASEEEVVELGGREEITTNNRMELQAALKSLQSAHAKSDDQVTVYADSSYVINGITKWVYGWKKNGWLTQSKQAVSNEDLWKELVKVIELSEAKVKWQYVGGHVGIAGNERVDEIAASFAEGNPVALYTGSRQSYSVDLLNLEKDLEKSVAKSSTRAHSKAKAYSYISEVDGVVLTHKTWSECEARVRGQKARYKKSISSEDEKNILSEFSK